MTRYQVFDCTRRTGVVCHARGWPMAHIVAWALSRATGRTHDFSAVAS